MQIILTNDFHNTTVTLRTRTGLLSQRQVNRARETLCGVEGCTCGGFLGERGPQAMEIEEHPCGGVSIGRKA